MIKGTVFDEAAKDGIGDTRHGRQHRSRRNAQLAQVELFRDSRAQLLRCHRRGERLGIVETLWTRARCRICKEFTHSAIQAYQFFCIGCASVLNTTLSKSSVLVGAKSRYEYLSVSAKKKLSMLSRFSLVRTSFSAANPASVLQYFTSSSNIV